MPKPKRQYACGLKFPKGTSKVDRILCWKIIKSIAVPDDGGEIVVACSGGIDSTVLAHATAQILKLLGGDSVLTLAYVNHGLRDEVRKEIEHVTTLATELCAGSAIFTGRTRHGSAVQERARKKRYYLLSAFCLGKKSYCRLPYLLTAHNANDQAETILFRTLTGRKQVGIATTRDLKWGYLYRPLLAFTRKDIERYAKVFDLKWCEDSSNSTDKYTRNRIRHHLIPWIEANINPSVVRVLANG